MHGDADIASVATVMGNPARGRMLSAMMDGRALPASDLAAVGRVSPSTASAHLAALTAAGLVVVERQGRHRYHRLAGEDVAQAIEALAAIAPVRPVVSLRDGNRSTAERAARTCYDHAAGALGVALADRLCAIGALEPASLAVRDPAPFAALGVDVDALGPGRRPLTRSCLDWSERRPHLAGRLGAALLHALLDSAWVVRREHGRAVAVTPRGRARLAETVGLDVAAVAPGALSGLRERVAPADRLHLGRDRVHDVHDRLHAELEHGERRRQSL
jgi:DNA-binding transcriptional ArsR family regulator